MEKNDKSDPIPEQLQQYRKQIDSLDEVIVEKISRRLEICSAIASLKRSLGISMMQPARVQVVYERVCALAVQRKLNPEFAKDLYSLIIAEACRLEDKIINA